MPLICLSLPVVFFEASLLPGSRCESRGEGLDGAEWALEIQAVEAMVHLPEDQVRVALLRLVGYDLEILRRGLAAASLEIHAEGPELLVPLRLPRDQQHPM